MKYCAFRSTFIYKLFSSLLLFSLALTFWPSRAASAAANTWSATGSLGTARYLHTATLLADGHVLIAGGYNGNILSSAELYDPFSGAWSATDSLIRTRYYHTATLLPDGRVLVVGGGGLTSVELYDPTNGTWSYTGSLATARYWHTATLLADGRVLVVGGDNLGGGTLSSAELYDPVSGAWSTTGSLATARYWHTATLLPDGRVLVAGGFDDNATLVSAEVYDPVSGTWSTTGSLATARYHHTATLLTDGRILAVGGFNRRYSNLASAELYDPISGTWSSIGSTGTARSIHTATLLPDGRILVAGGYGGISTYLASAELYNPANGTWSAASPMATAHSSHTATLLPDGHILIAGGYDGSSPGASAELYDPAGGTWSTTDPLWYTRASHTATLLPDGSVMVTGGDNNGTSVSNTRLYDPGSEIWTTVGSLAKARQHHTATLLVDGRVLAAGGFNNISGRLASAELYAPASGTWSTTGSMAKARSDFTATLLPDGRVLVAGGLSNSGGYLSSVELYDPASGSWSATGSMGMARTRHAAALLPDGRVLVAGGWNSSTYLASVELYDPISGTWSATGSMAAAREYLKITLLPNGRVLATGGRNGSGALASAELYDVAGGSWSNTGSMVKARMQHTVTLLPDGRILAAGGWNNSNGALTNTELYNPASGVWGSSGSMGEARYAHSATLLPDGRVLVAGGSQVSRYLYSAELYDRGLGFQPAWRPSLDAFVGPMVPGESLSASGTNLRGYGLAEASGGATNNSASNYPLLQLRYEDSERSLWLPFDGSSPITVTAPLSSGLPIGPAWVTVFVNGIPSQSRYVELNHRPAGGNGQVSLLEDTSKTFSSGDFTYSDADGDVFGGIQVTALETAGDLRCGGAPVVTGTLCSPLSNLVFTPTLNANGNPYASFEFKVIQAHLGLASASSYTMTLEVIPVNDSPLLAPIDTQSAGELTTLSFTANASDPDQGDVLTYTLDAGAPGGASINPATGQFTWTPGETDGPGVYTITVRVRDDGVPALSDSNTTQIAVYEVNLAPTLASIGDWSIDELTLLTFTASASDSDIPTNTLTYTLDAGAPSGASIEPGTGQFTWTPSENQGPGVYSITVRVSDDGVPGLDDFETLQVTVNEINLAPVLAVIGDRSVDELTPLSFTASASDPDQGDVLTYTLDAGAPGGASIDPGTGQFTWTPGEADGPGVYTITVRVNDDGVPALEDFETLQITVKDVNSAPVLIPIGDRSVDELTSLSFMVSASDSDIPTNMLTYTLDAGAPGGASIDPGTGQFTWTPDEADGPGVYTITVRVGDDGSPTLDDFETLQVTVNEINQTPLLASIGDQSVDELTTLSFMASASDPDLPANMLTYSLDIGAPGGASIDPGAGQFTWTPGEAEGPGVYTITVRVSDNGIPGLDDFQTIRVTVNEINQAPLLTFIGNQNVDEMATLSFNASASDTDVPANTLIYTLDAGAPAGASINPGTGQFTWTPGEADGPGVYTITVRVRDDGAPALEDFKTLQVTVNEINQAPVLAPIGDQSVNELTTLNFTACAGDSDLPANTLTYSLDAGAPAGASIDPGTGQLTWMPSEGQGPGVYTITVRVSDDGAPALEDAKTLIVTVNEVNLAPLVVAVANQKAVEGQPISFSGSFIDPGRGLGRGPLAGEIILWDMGDGAVISATLTPTYTYGDNGVYTVTLTVTDSLGGVGQDTLLVTVDNAPASLAPLSYQTGVAGDSVFVSSTFSDPGWLDTHTVTIEWAPGVTDTLNLASGEYAFAFEHIYAQSGIYMVTVTVIDDDGGTDSQEFSISIASDLSRIFLPLAVR